MFQPHIARFRAKRALRKAYPVIASLIRSPEFTEALARKGLRWDYEAVINFIAGNL